MLIYMYKFAYSWERSLVDESEVDELGSLSTEAVALVEDNPLLILFQMVSRLGWLSLLDVSPKG